MNYELGLFSNLVRITLCSSVFTELSMTVEVKNQMETMIELEVNRIRCSMNNVVYSNVSENKIRRYIRQNQREITWLSNDISDLKNEFLVLNRSKVEDFTNQLAIFDFLKVKFTDLLVFIQRYFSNYFDTEMCLPLSCINLVMSKKIKKIRPLFNRFKELSISPGLIKPLKTHLFTALRSTNLNYSELNYIQQFIAFLPAAIDNNQNSDCDIKFITKMVYLNFNNLEFYMEVRLWIRVQLANEKDLFGQLSLLRTYQIYIEQFHEHPDLQHRKGSTTLKEMLANFIDKEIRYREVSKEDVRSIATVKPGFESLLVTFSVPQLAYLLRLMVKNKLFRINNRMSGKMLDFIAKWITTGGTGEKMSAGHLKNEYHDPKRSAAIALKAILLKLLAMIDWDLEKKL